ncbi:hypothetical protein [Almyronema epifaneia]|uniref:Uncharacterized protein n=1 Tax=Almyronema epifaneia S1 TaxID=2991925 RepID=A0ABW6IKU4_9CYAN
MGHTRLGKVPKTQKWTAVVSLIAGSDASGGGGGGGVLLADDIQAVSQQTLDAAQEGLKKAIDDLGLRYTFYLLTQLVLAARTEDWVSDLDALGIQLTEDATVFDLTSELQNAIDVYIETYAFPTDVSEIAQQAAGEAISELAGTEQIALFSSSREELQRAIRGLSTKKGFSKLGQIFFGRFMSRFLNFYLSRITAANSDSDRLKQIGDISRFNDSLRRHCEQSAQIVHDFCGQWYSKTEFEKGIDLSNTSGFMAVAIRKLQDELMQQGGEL